LIKHSGRRKIVQGNKIKVNKSEDFSVKAIKATLSKLIENTEVE